MQLEFKLQPKYIWFEDPDWKFINPTKKESSLFENLEAVIPLSKVSKFLDNLENLESCPYEIHFIN